MGSNPIFSAIYRGIAQLVEQRSPKPRAVGSNPTAPATFYGVWRSLVAHLVWDQRAAGSNPATPTKAMNVGH